MLIADVVYEVSPTPPYSDVLQISSNPCMFSGQTGWQSCVASAPIPHLSMQVLLAEGCRGRSCGRGDGRQAEALPQAGGIAGGFQPRQALQMQPVIAPRTAHRSRYLHTGVNQAGSFALFAL